MLSSEQLRELASYISPLLQWPEYMDVNTAGRYMDRSGKAVRHLVEDNRLPATKLDCKIQIRRKDIDEAFEKGLL